MSITTKNYDDKFVRISLFKKRVSRMCIKSLYQLKIDSQLQGCDWVSKQHQLSGKEGCILVVHTVKLTQVKPNLSKARQLPGTNLQSKGGGLFEPSNVVAVCLVAVSRQAKTNQRAVVVQSEHTLPVLAVQGRGHAVEVVRS